MTPSRPSAAQLGLFPEPVGPPETGRGVSVEWAASGAGALQAVRAALARAQSGDRLRPVTVVVPSNSVGVATRRWLAAHGGVAAANFVTIYRLAEVLGSPALVAAGRKPVSNPVVDVIVRRVLAERPGIFGPVAHHPSTVVTLRNAHRELRLAPPAAATVLQRGSAQAAEVVRVHRAVSARLAAGWYDEADLHVAAAAAVASLAEPAPVVCYLPQHLSVGAVGLLQALAGVTTVHLVLGQTGDPDTDGFLARHLRGAGLPVPDPDPAAPVLPPQIDVVDCSDADDEVREALRRVIAAVRGGVTLDRIAVVHPPNGVYERILAEQLGAAGIAWNGSAATTLAERIASRFLLDLCDLDRRGPSRADLFALLAGLPARRRGRPLPVARWERVSRAAGVGRDWESSLSRFEAGRRAVPEAEPHRQRALREADAAADLRGFVAAVLRTLGPRDAARSWKWWAEWSRERLAEWLGEPATIPGIDDAELAAFDAVHTVLDRLAHLDAVDGAVTRAQFRDTFAAEIDSAPSRVGRIGGGLLSGPPSFAVGHDLDLLVVVGTADGQFPSTPAADPLIPDGERAATGSLRTAEEQRCAERSSFLSALAGAGAAALVWARGDLRANVDRQPSRWIDDLAAATEVRRLSRESFVAGVAGASHPSTGRDHRLRGLLHHLAAGHAFGDHPAVRADAALPPALAMVTARASDRFTVYDGNLAGAAISSPLSVGPVSPTRLEAWASCPHAYFVRYVLGVQPEESPDEQLSITALDRGSLVHATLHALHDAVLSGALPPPGDGWNADHEAYMLTALSEAAADLEAAGLTGKPSMWAVEQATIVQWLREWMKGDSVAIRERRSSILHSERSFGDEQQVTIPLGDGRAVSVRGTVDRIDTGADGTVYVTDHKTGSQTRYKKLTADDPTATGTKLQLAIYAAAARVLVGDPAAVVHTEYSFIGREPGRIGFPLDDRAGDGVAAQLARIVDGIEQGMFIDVPGAPVWKPFVDCEYCDPDGLGTAAAYDRYLRKSLDPQVAAFLGSRPGGEDEDG